MEFEKETSPSQFKLKLFGTLRSNCRTCQAWTLWVRILCRAVVDTVSSTVSRQSRIFDCRQSIIAVSTEFCQIRGKTLPGAENCPCDCRDPRGPTVDRQVSIATTALVLCEFASASIVPRRLSVEAYNLHISHTGTLYTTCRASI